MLEYYLQSDWEVFQSGLKDHTPVQNYRPSSKASVKVRQHPGITEFLSIHQGRIKKKNQPCEKMFGVIELHTCSGEG